MKQTILYLLLGTFLLASCQQEDISSNTATGYLVLESIDVQVNQQTVSSRAVDADLYVDILQEDAIFRQYGPGMVPDRIELPEGTYRLHVYNAAATLPDPYDGNGVAIFEYTGEPITVEANGTTLIEEIEVPMINFGVTLQLPEEFNTYFKNYAFTVTSDRSVELKEGETAYFPYNSDKVTFSYSLKATNADGEESEPEGGTRNEVVSGTIYTVSYEMETQSLNITE
ncbi:MULTISPECIES: DUF4493 domain-containing protein [unclassified Bacteroides]|uniref:DUF4493 domain-containing protein n=1 Tax=unclassified Bacteroides TaxID=2646097 RepID=UPI000B371412|nr:MULTISPECIES: DUF4493 domain-containing protein [unclassified Bacteroides]OUN82586.1 hypothetical protein B5G04_03210 [Bacteroides sp. An51A]OUP28436.1 hypothetical protein B5F25_17645 [Bacteroides sp. An19]